MPSSPTSFPPLQPFMFPAAGKKSCGSARGGTFPGCSLERGDSDRWPPPRPWSSGGGGCSWWRMVMVLEEAGCAAAGVSWYGASSGRARLGCCWNSMMRSPPCDAGFVCGSRPPGLLFFAQHLVEPDTLLCGHHSRRPCRSFICIRISPLVFTRVLTGPGVGQRPAPSSAQDHGVAGRRPNDDQ